MTQEIRRGKWCHFEILTLYEQLCGRVCQVTNDLMKLADKYSERQAMNKLRRSLPPDMTTGTRLGAIVGGELHKFFYDLAVRARQAGMLDPRLKITRPTNQRLDPKYTRKGERSAAHPDFVLSGIFDGDNIHEAWDFTTIESMPAHYDHDILGRKRPVLLSINGMVRRLYFTAGEI